MTRLMTIVGTRPELIKMSRVIAELDKFTDHYLVHTGQNYDYELNEVFFKEMGIRRPNIFLSVSAENVSKTIANIIEKSDKVMEDFCPDAILFYGDTNSCLAAICAKRRKIPIFHMEAGNRSYDQRVPEELNRKIVDHLSDINMVLTEHSRQHLIAEGVAPETIVKTGSHMQEVLDYYMPSISESKILNDLSLSSGKYFVVSIHREENIDSDSKLRSVIGCINDLASCYEIPIIFSVHPRTRKRIEGTDGLKISNFIRFMRPFGFFDYVKLQMNALCIISDSGTISEEAALLDLPAVTLRDAHERPEAMDSNIFIMAGASSSSFLTAIRVAIQHHKGRNVMKKIVDYEGGLVSAQVLRVILSYIDYVNRTVWFKH